jgi:hypothetical protein
LNANSSLDDVSVNRRHTIAQAFLIPIAIGPLALRLRQRGTWLGKTVAYSGVVFAWGIIFMSFSRTSWLEAAIMVFFMFTPVMITPQRIRWWILGFVSALVFVLAFGFGDGFLGLIAGRLEQTQSYDARLSASSERWHAIALDPFFGTASSHMTDWAHDLLLDFWSAGGIVSGALVLLIVFVLFRRMNAGMLRVAFSNPVRARYHAFATALLGPIFGRMFTVPGGQMEIGVWIALGFASGIGTQLHLSQREVSRQRRRSDPASPGPNGIAAVPVAAHRPGVAFR